MPVKTRYARPIVIVISQARRPITASTSLLTCSHHASPPVDSISQNVACSGAFRRTCTLRDAGHHSAASARSTSRLTGEMRENVGDLLAALKCIEVGVRNGMLTLPGARQRAPGDYRAAARRS